MLYSLLVIVLVLMLVGALPIWPQTPSSGLPFLLVLVVLLLRGGP
jgi:hypothetical protein